ncbi:hypothetical protein H072_6910 [Dactylellina haptotyla CBS 200.50]|uniref:Uncharacterized protein n=1 Tax=Dactylellina haptotyla (strain CBS 200.50) TaxID=1284197 RepID=S8A906_DACHA|nr:hypothetical protein H072_6910 [Dactylellina haptotyla CBS 200.50]
MRQANQKAAAQPPSTTGSGCSVKASHSKRSPITRVISDRVVIPLVALGLSTPIVSHAICFVGSKILKHKMDRETEQVLFRGPRGSPFDGSFQRNGSIALSREEEKMRKAEMKEHFKHRKMAAKIQRESLKQERATMRKYRKQYIRNIRKQGAQPEGISNVISHDTFFEDDSDELMKPRRSKGGSKDSRGWVPRMKEKYNLKKKKSKRLGFLLGLGWWGNY